MSDHKIIVQALAVTAELTGTELSQAAMMQFARDLMAYPSEGVLKALERCRKELKGRLTLAVILERIDDDRPGADEAWGIVVNALQDEAETVVWTEDMSQAAESARDLLLLGDKTGARMAFRSAYERIVNDARAEKRQVKWLVSAGTDSARRAAVILRAVEQGRLSSPDAVKMLPYQATEERHQLLTGRVMTPEERRLGQQKVKSILAMLPAKPMPKEDAA